MKIKHNKKITPEQEKEIFELYNKGEKRNIIKHKYQITDGQLMNIVKIGINKENKKKDGEGNKGLWKLND